MSFVNQPPPRGQDALDAWGTAEAAKNSAGAKKDTGMRLIIRKDAQGKQFVVYDKIKKWDFLTGKEQAYFKDVAKFCSEKGLSTEALTAKLTTYNQSKVKEKMKVVNDSVLQKMKGFNLPPQRELQRMSPTDQVDSRSPTTSTTVAEAIETGDAEQIRDRLQEKGETPFTQTERDELLLKLIMATKSYTQRQFTDVFEVLGKHLNLSEPIKSRDDFVKLLLKGSESDHGHHSILIGACLGQNGPQSADIIKEITLLATKHELSREIEKHEVLAAATSSRDPGVLAAVHKLYEKAEKAKYTASEGTPELYARAEKAGYTEEAHMPGNRIVQLTSADALISHLAENDPDFRQAVAAEIWRNRNDLSSTQLELIKTNLDLLLVPISQNPDDKTTLLEALCKDGSMEIGKLEDLLRHTTKHLFKTSATVSTKTSTTESGTKTSTVIDKIGNTITVKKGILENDKYLLNSIAKTLQREISSPTQYISNFIQQTLPLRA